MSETPLSASLPAWRLLLLGYGHVARAFLPLQRNALEVGYIVKKYAARAKLINVSPRNLRHRFGYRMAESVPLHWLAQIMGHDSMSPPLCWSDRVRAFLKRAHTHSSVMSIALGYPDLCPC